MINIIQQIYTIKVKKNIFIIFIPDYFLHEFIYLFGVSIIFFFFLFNEIYNKRNFW
jgi:dTDP-4-dehydrorhamnose 3,5-epimerase-like enzyme